MTAFGFSPLGSAPFGDTGGDTVTIIEGLGFRNFAENRPVMVVGDAMSWADDATSAHIIHVIESILLAAESGSTAGFLQSVSDGYSLREISLVVLRFIVSDSFDLADDAAAIHRQIVTAVDTLLAAGLASSKLGAINAVSAALVLDDIAHKVFFADAAIDGFEFADAVTRLAALYQRVVDGYAIDDLASNTLRMTAIVQDGFVLADAAGSQAAFFNACVDGLVLNAAIKLDDGEYVAWVINTESKAVSRYTNYGFNSFARHQHSDKYYGAKPDGVYLLAGADDDGDAIDAVVRSGMTDFGMAAVKAIPLAYLGLTTDGQMVMRMITTSNEGGEKIAHWYRLEERAAAALRETRIKIGGGLESVWWQWELVNVDGADFEVSSIRWLPAILSRRI